MKMQGRLYGRGCWVKMWVDFMRSWFQVRNDLVWENLALRQQWLLYSHFIFSEHFSARVAGMKVEEAKTAHQSLFHLG